LGVGGLTPTAERAVEPARTVEQEMRQFFTDFAKQ
jgi:hypothetical protein